MRADRLFLVDTSCWKRARPVLFRARISLTLLAAGRLYTKQPRLGKQSNGHRQNELRR
jgi:hypothetical protein